MPCVGIRSHCVREALATCTGLRIDPAHSAGGLRLNQWVSIGAFSAAALFIGITRLRSRGDREASTVNEHE